MTIEYAAAALAAYMDDLGIDATIGHTVEAKPGEESKLYIYRKRMLCPPVIKGLEVTGWHGFKVKTAHIGSVQIKTK